MDTISALDWSTIARCLDDEATDADLAELRRLRQQHPDLSDWMLTNEFYVPNSAAHFDAESAFKKIHHRFRNENLI